MISQKTNQKLAHSFTRVGIKIVRIGLTNEAEKSSIEVEFEKYSF